MTSMNTSMEGQRFALLPRVFADDTLSPFFETTDRDAARFSLRVACSMALSFPTNFARSLMSIFGIAKRSRSVFSLRSSTLLASHGLPEEVWNR
jgi:hypothetical protein